MGNDKCDNGFAGSSSNYSTDRLVGGLVGATLGYVQAVPKKRAFASIGDDSFQVAEFIIICNFFASKDFLNLLMIVIVR